LGLRRNTERFRKIFSVTQKPAQWSQHGGQKQYRTTYRTVPTSSIVQNNISHSANIQYSTEQHIAQCQHPEGTHIYTVEMVRPQGMKKEQTKQRNTSQQKLQEYFTRQYSATIQRAIWLKNTPNRKKTTHATTSAIKQQQDSQLNIRWSSTHG